MRVKLSMCLTLGALAASAAFGVSGAIGYAYQGAEGRAATAPGQVNAIGNCIDTIIRQNANGQVKDSTIGLTAVTNCDHFWQFQP